MRSVLSPCLEQPHPISLWQMYVPSHSFKMVSGSLAAVCSCGLSGRVLPVASLHQPQGSPKRQTSDCQDVPWWSEY